MRRTKFVLLALPIAVVALVVGVVNAGGAGAADEPTGRWGRVFNVSDSAAARSAQPAAAEFKVSATARSLTFVQETTGNEAFVDHPPRGESVGDSFIFRDRLREPRTNAHVGSLSVECTLVFFTTECKGSAIIFDRGTITLAGVVPNGPRFAVAITGGTREFRVARGQARLGHVGTLSHGAGVGAFLASVT